MIVAAQKVSDSRQALTETPAKFDAFLSYSHAADGRLATAVQAGLQGLTRPWYRLRALHVFRDKTSLAANPALWPTIVAALQESRYFLLMASPGRRAIQLGAKRSGVVASASPCRPVADRAHRGGPRLERHVGGLRLATHDGAPESPGPPIRERATLRRCTLGARSGAFVLGTRSSGMRSWISLRRSTAKTRTFWMARTFVDSGSPAGWP